MRQIFLCRIEGKYIKQQYSSNITNSALLHVHEWSETHRHVIGMMKLALNCIILSPAENLSKSFTKNDMIKPSYTKPEITQHAQEHYIITSDGTNTETNLGQRAYTLQHINHYL